MKKTMIFLFMASPVLNGMLSQIPLQTTPLKSGKAQHIDFRESGKAGNYTTECWGNQVWLWDRDLIINPASSEIIPSRAIVVFSPNNTVYLATRTQTPLNFIFDHGADIKAYAVSNDETMLATFGHDKTLQLWDIQNRTKRLSIVHDCDGLYTSLEISPDSTLIAVGRGRYTKIWEAATGKFIATLHHRTSVSAIKFSSDGKYILTNNAGPLILWSIDTFVPIRIFREIGGFKHAEVSLNWNYLVTYAGTANAKVWDMHRGNCMNILWHNTDVTCVRIAPNENYIAILANGDQDVYIWEIKTGTCIAIIKPDIKVSQMHFSQDGSLLTIDYLYREIRYWDITIRPLTLNPNPSTRLSTLIPGFAVFAYNKIIATELGKKATHYASQFYKEESSTLHSFILEIQNIIALLYDYKQSNDPRILLECHKTIKFFSCQDFETDRTDDPIGYIRKILSRYKDLLLLNRRDTSQARYETISQEINYFESYFANQTTSEKDLNELSFILPR